MQADYVVVGAGSAGCTVAARLSESGASVIVLEAGPGGAFLTLQPAVGCARQSLARGRSWTTKVLPLR
jgi:choline dehydrogenase-like flavoprotein